MLEQIEIELINPQRDDTLTVYLDIFDNSLSRKWLPALEHLLENNFHLEKNFCFLGWVQSPRGPEYICNRINQSIAAINSAGLGYQIDDHFAVDNTIVPGPRGPDLPGGLAVQEKFNWLHRYFEDLQGVSGQMSQYYNRADPQTRWHIRQLNLLCHEYESLILSLRKLEMPEWRRPSQLMCWLNAPRFVLTAEDYELFGIDTINRPLGGVFVGVNKAVGKHHWEVFCDEGRDSRLDELTTTVLNSQTEAAGDFDIEWGNNPGQYWWQQRKMAEFAEWLIANGFDPNDKSLTIGHPQIGQIDLQRSFGNAEYMNIWNQIGQHLDVYQIKTSRTCATYTYTYDDDDFAQRQIAILSGEQ